MDFLKLGLGALIARQENIQGTKFYAILMMIIETFIFFNLLSLQSNFGKLEQPYIIASA